MGGDGGREGPAAVLERLDEGVEVPEGTLVRCLRSPACPRELVERLAACRWVRSLRRAVPLLMRHPGCPQAFAFDALPRIGWHDLLLVVRDPRTRPAIRHQGERRLLERLKRLTVGERTALARYATPGVIAAMLADEAPACIAALLDSPQFTEQDAVRLLNVNDNSACAMAVVRHPRWGASQAVVSAAVRSPVVPLGLALGLIASLSRSRLEELACARDVPAALQAPLRQLLDRRRTGR